MTQRLYYHDSFLYDFDACVVESVERDGKHAVVLDRTAFYPTSGGQVHDTGQLALADNRAVVVHEVVDEEGGRIFHMTATPVDAGTTVHGSVDAARRRDHIQQHSGQHVLSAAFIRLFNMPTISFHMGAEICTIDLETSSISADQMQKAEQLANEIIFEDRRVAIRFVPLEEAQQLGLRKLPPKQTGDLRLIDIQDFDLTACGGTHVRATGQIGAILLRKMEKVKQGMRVEFVCGQRAVALARKDFTTLTEAASAYSAHIHDLPQQVRKAQEEAKAAAKAQQRILEEVAQLSAERLLMAACGGPRVVVELFPERDAAFTKLLAQKLTADTTDVVAILACGSSQPTLIFAQSPGQEYNMGQLMKDILTRFGGRGGGTADMAQGGLPSGTDIATIEKILREASSKL